jgi:hypothetical protein
MHGTEARAAQGGDRVASMSVSDDGIGMPEEPNLKESSSLGMSLVPPWSSSSKASWRSCAAAEPGFESRSHGGGRYERHDCSLMRHSHLEDEPIVAKDLQQTLREMNYDAFAIASSPTTHQVRTERCRDLVLMGHPDQGRAR